MADMRALFASMMHEGCEKMLGNEEFIQSIEKEKFDVMFLHHYDLCPYAVAHITKIPKTVLTISSSTIEMLTRVHGHLNPPSLIPSLLGNFTCEMSISERFKNFAISVGLEILTYYYERGYQEIFEGKLGQDFPQIRKLMRKVKLIFTNDFEILDYPRPTLYKIINIGGLGMDIGSPSGKDPEIPLEDEFKNFIENSNNPTVLVSLGTVTDPKYVPKKWITEFIRFFEENPEINFIWKFEDPEINLPKNVLMKKWIPQVPILSNKKTVAFLSHCGYNGLQESIFTGVPILCRIWKIGFEIFVFIGYPFERTPRNYRK